MLTLTLSNKCEIGTISTLPVDVLEKIRSRFTFDNPAWQEAKRRGYWTGAIPRELCFARESDNTLCIPRGATRQVIEILKSNGVDYRINDQRRELPPVEYAFSGKLRDYQQQAIDDMLQRDHGVLVSPTGSGKTTMALKLIAELKQPALVVVHTKELQAQWVDRIEAFLGIPRDQVGVIGGGKWTIGEQITVGLVQSLVKCAGEVSPLVGHMVVDECHHCPSRTFTEVVSAFDCRYMTGLSATPYRRDGLGRLIWWHLGDKRHEVDRAMLTDQSHIMEPEIITRDIGSIESEHDPRESYSRFITDLLSDPDRNRAICDDIQREYQAGATVLVLSDRVQHCRTLQAMLAHMGMDAVLLNGRLSKSVRTATMNGIVSGHDKVILATSALCGEGLDVPSLDVLVLASPVRFGGRLVQYVGRVLRPAPGKRAPRIIDYNDLDLTWQSKARERVYRTIGGAA